MGVRQKTQPDKQNFLFAILIFVSEQEEFKVCWYPSGEASRTFFIFIICFFSEIFADINKLCDPNDCCNASPKQFILATAFRVIV